MTVGDEIASYSILFFRVRQYAYVSVIVLIIKTFERLKLENIIKIRNTECKLKKNVF